MHCSNVKYSLPMLSWIFPNKGTVVMEAKVQLKDVFLRTPKHFTIVIPNVPTGVSRDHVEK
jgi:hypothetical protein